MCSRVSAGEKQANVKPSERGASAASVSHLTLREYAFDGPVVVVHRGQRLITVGGRRLEREQDRRGTRFGPEI